MITTWISNDSPHEVRLEGADDVRLFSDASGWSRRRISAHAHSGRGLHCLHYYILLPLFEGKLISYYIMVTMVNMVTMNCYILLLYHITSISTTSTAVQGILGQQNSVHFCVSQPCGFNMQLVCTLLPRSSEAAAETKTKMATVRPCWLPSGNLT